MRGPAVGDDEWRGTDPGCRVFHVLETDGRLIYERGHFSQPADGPVRLQTDFYRAAPCLMIDGALKVNSASVGAWEALLPSGLGEGHGADGVAFPRTLDPVGGEWTGGRANGKGAWSGQRVSWPSAGSRPMKSDPSAT